MSSLSGGTVGRYRILDEISRGGMGVVYRAVDTSLGREVAIKVLPADLVADPDRKRRFLEEARTASRLEHPNIGVIYEVDEAGGTSFIAMELIRGQKLSEIIERGALSVPRSLDLAIEIAEALALAHDKGVVHRDIKPANVMVTEQGHAKIIDFGLAKLVTALSGEAVETAAATDPGIVLGTAAYMSPEQARAASVDARSDIFSFGVLLYELLTGRLPFGRQSGVDSLHALLHDPVPPLPPLGPDVGPAVAADLQRILEKCLAKEPDLRYQGSRDLVVDLRAVRRRLESGSASVAYPAAQSGAVATARRGRRVPSGVAAAIVVVALAVGGVAAWRWRYGTVPSPSTSGRSSLAVMYFQNHTGDPQLDWLRTGLTEMVVTDLSQSPNVEILGTDRLVQILTALHRQNDEVVSFDTVQEIARRAGVRNVLLGSYIKSGDTLRINVTLQEAATGRIISSERIDSAGASNLFPTVDDLTRRIKAKFSLPPDRGIVPAILTRPADSAGAEFFKALSEVTTSSTEAYRFYAQAIDLHQRGQDRESVPLFEKALEIDPDFALAMTKLAVVEGNVGHWDRRDAFARRAIEHAERLAPRERYYIEGYYYSLRDETLSQGIDAYRKAIALYPDHASAIHNLAVTFDDLERYDEAVKLYQGLLSRPGFQFTFTFTNMAIADQKLGKSDEARRVLEDLLRRQPDNAAAYRNFGEFLNSSGKPDEALAAFAKADTLDGGDPESTHGRWTSAILKKNLTDADEAARIDQNGRDAFSRWVGNNERALNEMYRGNVDAALALLDQNAVAPSTGSDQASRAASTMSGFLLRLGRPAAALTQARRSLRDARTSTAGWESSYYEILALSRLGQDEAAASALKALTDRAEALPSDREKRQIHWLRGVMALDHHQIETAIAELSKAEAMLPPKGVPPPAPRHPLIWFDLGSAYLAAGDDKNAEVRFQRVVDATESARAPIEFVRSLNFLSEIAGRRGDLAKAGEYRRRYLDYWKDSKGLSEGSKR